MILVNLCHRELIVKNIERMKIPSKQPLNFVFTIRFGKTDNKLERFDILKWCHDNSIEITLERWSLTEWINNGKNCNPWIPITINEAITIRGGFHLIIRNEADAVAFKLRWA
jgi:hypothetical protein